jgi:hypothetical protein
MRTTKRRCPTTNGMWASLRAGFLCLFAGAFMFAQTGAPVAANAVVAPGPLPLRLLYRHFLAFQNQLDRAAAARDRQGKDGSGLRNHYQNELGFTDAQFDAVRQAGLRLESELKQQDAKAKAVIDAVRAQHPRVLKSAADLPPVPPELVELQKGRNDLIDQEVDHLKTELGPAAAAKLDNYLQRNFASNVKVQSVPPPPAQGRFSHPVSTSAKGVQQ